MMETKICKNCHQNKPFSLFSPKGKVCFDCQKEKQKLRAIKYYNLNKESYLARVKEYKNNNPNKEKTIEQKERFKQYKKKYIELHKEDIAQKSKIKRGVNKKEIQNSKKKYYQQNKSKILAKVKAYRNKNYDKMQKYHNEYEKNRSKYDIAFKLRKRLSNNIRCYLINKKESSCLAHLQFTMKELKEHLESLFEPWMTWENWGVYSSKSWNDNDSATWKWQIDHIIPQSTFKYTSMEDQTFKDCWALSNLRPLSAKQNHHDGVNRTRHQGQI